MPTPDQSPGNGGMAEDRPCHHCGKNPAEGFASVWTREQGERWYCHGDADGFPTCYDLAPQMPFRPGKEE